MQSGGPGFDPRPAHPDYMASKGQDLGQCPEPGCSNRILYAGRGKHPQVCPAHGDRRNRAKKLRRAAKLQGQEHAEQVARSAGQEVLGPSSFEGPVRKRATDHLRLAIGLSATDDVDEAAALTGVVGYSPEDLETLAVRARQEKGLLTLEAGAVGQQIRLALSLMVVDMLDKVSRSALPAGQAGTTIKALAQAMDLLQGGPNNAYVPIQLVVAGPDGVTYDFSSRPEAGRGHTGSEPS